MSYKALLFCPDERTARVVTQVLNELEFQVEPCNEPFAAVKKLMADHFDALVVDCDNEQNAALLFKSARNSGSNQTSLSVAVVEGQSGVAKAFRIGANLVLTKPINVEQSKGTLRVARGLLRKTESAKTPGSVATSHAPVPSVPAHAESRHPASSDTLVAKPMPAFLAAQPPASVSPVATASTFELEKEPTPQLDPTESALLESMPDPMGGKNLAADSSPASTKEYPWQPVSKPMAEPMASALRRAAEAVRKPEVDSAAVSHASTSTNFAQPAASHSHSAGTGMAQAAAPAKDASWSDEAAHTEKKSPGFSSTTSEHGIIQFDAAEVDPQIDATQEDTAEFKPASSTMHTEGSNNKLVLIAAVVLVAIAGVVYMQWSKTHPAATLPKPSAIVQAPAASSTSKLQSSTVPATPVQTYSAEVIATPLDQPAVPSHAPKSSSIATTSITADAKPTSVKETQELAQEPLMVSSETPKPVQSAPAAPDSIQPPSLTPDSSSSDAIAGLVNAPVSIPHAAPGTLTISQGVSQGLLVKKVQPIYPPEALQGHIEGAVQLEANINKDGTITNVKRLSGDSILGRAAVTAVKQWKYKPYYLNGEPVEIQTQITVNFKLP